MKCVVILLVLSLALVSPCLGAISQETQQYVTQLVTDAINGLKNTRIPDIHERNGKNEFWIRSIDIRSITMPNIQVTEVGTDGLRWTVANAGLSLHANWRAKRHSWIPVSMSGTVDASLSGLRISVTMTVVLNADGTTKISLSDCSSTVGRVNIDLHGRGIFGFLANFAEGRLERKVKSQIPEKICAKVRDFVIKRK
jgi:hypothetical protein